MRRKAIVILIVLSQLLLVGVFGIEPIVGGVGIRAPTVATRSLINDATYADTNPLPSISASDPGTILSFKWLASYYPIGFGEAGILAADIDGNGIEEIIYAGYNGGRQNGTLTVLNGTDGSVIDYYEDADIGSYAKPQMADLNRDDALEIVVPLQDPAGVLALYFDRNDNKLKLYWRRSGARLMGRELFSSPVIYDINGDDYPEIFVASSDIYNGLNGTGRLTSLAYDGQILYQTFTWRPCGGGLSIADADNDGEFELYMGDRNTDYGNGTISYLARNLTQRWNNHGITESSNIPVLADVTKDGVLDVVAGDTDGGLAVLRSSDGSRIRMTLGIPNDAPVHYQFSVYDIDKDGNLEMLMADGSHNVTSQEIVVWDLVNWEVDARMDVGQCYYGPQVADVTGDGVMEMIACTDEGVYVFDSSYDLISSVNVTELPGGSRGTLNYAVVQDIDNDGYNELIVSSQDCRVYAFDTPAPTSSLRPRSEVQFYSEYRRGAAEYVPPPALHKTWVWKPTISPAGGVYSSPQSVTIQCATPDAIIHYTTDGSDPSSSSPVYAGSIIVSVMTTVKAIASKTGITDSDIASETYTFITTPTFSPSGGTYSSPQNVALSCSTIGATIRYTTDGSEPSSSSAVYSSPIPISSTTKIKAKAFMNGLAGGTATATYTITTPTPEPEPSKVSMPTFSLAGGMYSLPQDVALNCVTSGSTVRYTVDGSEPSSSSTVYSSPISVRANITLKAKAFAAGMTNSDTASADYIIILSKIATPTFSPSGGSYSSTQSVVIQCATPGPTIRYTTDGTEPSSSSPIYSSPISVSAATTIKAKAFMSWMAESDTASATYTIGASSQDPLFGNVTLYAAIAIATLAAASGASFYFRRKKS